MGIGACVALFAIAPSFLAPSPPPRSGMADLERELRSFRREIVTVAAFLRIHGDCSMGAAP